MARAGTIAGDLDKRVGDFVVRSEPKVTAVPEVKKPRKPVSGAAGLIAAARAMGKDKDPVIRQGLAQLHTLTEIARLTTERHKAVKAQGGDIPGVANFSKLGMGFVVRLTRDLGMQILGASGMLHAYDGAGREVLVKEANGAQTLAITGQALGAQALPIYGGTDQIQRNIIGERVLGLPKEPGDLANVPFNELPKNA